MVKAIFQLERNGALPRRRRIARKNAVDTADIVKETISHSQTNSRYAFPFSMPAVLKVDPQRRIVLSTFHGHVTSEDMLRQQEVIQTDPHFQSNFADVVDLSSMSVPDVDEAALRSLAGSRSIFDPGVPHVVIAPADVPYEMALKFRDLARKSRPNLHVVRTLADAQEILEKLGYRL